jgi:1-acyl-sn-glycerol-3-phosphate acyltransferase
MRREPIVLPSGNLDERELDEPAVDERAVDEGAFDEGDPLERDVDEWGRSERMCGVFHRAFDPVYRRWFRARWEGLEHVPQSGGALLVANHAGAVPADGPVIMHGIEKEVGRPVHVLADYTFWRMPVAGTIFARMGGVAAHPANAHRLLHEEGRLALVYPEGTKGTGKLLGERYRLRRFGRGGFVETAMRAGVPVVPIAVVGSEEAMPIVYKNGALARALRVPYVPVTVNMLLFGPAGLLLFFPAKFHLRVLEPVTFDVAPGQERYSSSVVMDEAEAIRERIQLALVDMLESRKSIWFG